MQGRQRKKRLGENRAPVLGKRSGRRECAAWNVCQMVLQSLRDLQEFSTLMNRYLLSLSSKTSCIIYRAPFRKGLITSELLDFYRAQELPSQIRPVFQLA